MCIREIPVHPWCTCPPSVHLADDECPHHVYINREHPLPSADSTTDLPAQDLLDPSTFPGPRWVHCPSYRAPDGTCAPGWELRCPETAVRILAHGPESYQRTYAWDGMCSGCERGVGHALPLVPVRRANAWEDGCVVEEQLVDPLTGAGWNDVADLPRLLKPDGSRVDEEVVYKMVSHRPERSWSERVFVHVEQRPANGVWEVDPDVSAIYLLPSSFPSWPAVESNAYPTKSKGKGGFLDFCIPGLTRHVAEFVLPNFHAYVPARSSVHPPPPPSPAPATRTYSDKGEEFQVSPLKHE